MNKLDQLEKQRACLTECVKMLTDLLTSTQPKAVVVDLDADMKGYFEEEELLDLARTSSTENSYSIGGRWEWLKFTPDQIVAFARAVKARGDQAPTQAPDPLMDEWVDQLIDANIRSVPADCAGSRVAVSLYELRALVRASLGAPIQPEEAANCKLPAFSSLPCVTEHCRESCFRERNDTIRVDAEPVADEYTAALVSELARCRRAFPIPAHGTVLDELWQMAMSDPLAVGNYVDAALAALGGKGQG